MSKSPLSKIRDFDSPARGELDSKNNSPLAGESKSLILERGRDTKGYKQSNLKHAKSMRKEMTKEEFKLWQKISGKQLGYKFKRQQPIENFIVDFVCFEKKLIIELDGSQHCNSDSDEIRDNVLGNAGFRVLRFWNNEVNENLNGVLGEILKHLKGPLSKIKDFDSPSRGELGKENNSPLEGESKSLILERGKIIIICGPTASGKSKAALEIAEKIDGEIINGDSLQVYKDVPILTSQPIANDLKKIKHHLYGFLEFDQDYSVAKWLSDVELKIKEIKARNKIPIIVGGTGMYLLGLMQGIRKIPEIPSTVLQESQKVSLADKYMTLCEADSNTKELFEENDISRIGRAYNIFKAHSITPTAYRKIPNTTNFKANDFLCLVITPERDELYQKCNDRFQVFFDQGALHEVKDLIAKNVDLSFAITKAIGFKPIYKMLKNEISKSDAIEQAKRETRNYAKRQLTWFRKQIPDNVETHYFYSNEEILGFVDD